MEPVYEHIHRGRQSWNYDAYYNDGTVVRRVQIVRDFFDHQSKAVVYKWNTNRGWVEIFSMPITNTPAGKVSSTSSEDIVTDPLKWTASVLLANANAILQGTVDSITSV